MPAPRGKSIWYDVMTPETKAAAALYSDVISWDAQEHQMPDAYTRSSPRGRLGLRG